MNSDNSVANSHDAAPPPTTTKQESLLSSLMLREKLLSQKHSEDGSGRAARAQVLQEEDRGPVWKSVPATFVLNRRVVLHAIDATPLDGCE